MVRLPRTPEVVGQVGVALGDPSRDDLRDAPGEHHRAQRHDDGRDAEPDDEERVQGADRRARRPARQADGEPGTAIPARSPARWRRRSTAPARPPGRPTARRCHRRDRSKWPDTSRNVTPTPREMTAQLLVTRLSMLSGWKKLGTSIEATRNSPTATAPARMVMNASSLRRRSPVLGRRRRNPLRVRVMSTVTSRATGDNVHDHARRRRPGRSDRRHERAGEQQEDAVADAQHLLQLRGEDRDRGSRRPRGPG